MTIVRRSSPSPRRRPNIIVDRVRFRQQKTGTVVDVPLHPKLRAIIEATPTIGIKHFVVTKSGEPFSIAGFGNRMRD
jgi:hypothetical protein